MRTVVRNVLICGAVTALATISCKKEEDKADAGTTGTTVATGTPIAQLALAPTDILDMFGASVQTLGTGMGTIAGSAAGLTEEGPISCSADSNEPIDNKDPSKNVSGGSSVPTMAESDERYGISKLYCLISSGPEYGDSIQAAFDTPKILLCALQQVEDQKFDNVKREVTITATRECFGDLLDDPDTGMTEGQEMTLDVTLSAPAVVAGWDYTIQLEKEGDSTHFVNFKAEKGKYIAFSTYQGGTQDVGDDYYSASVDVTTGELRYVYRRDITDCDGKTGDELKTCWGAGDNDQWQGTVNIAILATGDVNESGEFARLDTLDAAYMRAFANANNEYWARLATAKGSLTEGVTQRGYSHSTNVPYADFLVAANSPEEDHRKMCFKDQEDPTVGLCDGNDGTALTDDSQTIFWIHPADDRHPRNRPLWESAAPLTFESVDLANTEL